ncbi:putative E2 ubiquitin-conjugating enzyme [Microsporum audouinii]
MPRKAFIRDLCRASTPGAFSRLVDIKPGGDDGTLSCSLVLSEDPKRLVDLEFMVTDISLYPDEHEFFIYTTSEDVPHYVTDVLGQTQRGICRLDIPEMLSQLDYTFQRNIELKGGVGDSSVVDDIFLYGENTMTSEIENAPPDLNDDEYQWSSASQPIDTPITLSTKTGEEAEQEIEDLLYNISEDLKEVKLAGFRVGYVGNKICPIVSVSCRISKLGISEDAMKAWHIQEEQYLICLIRYIGRYQSLEYLLLEDEQTGKSSVEFRIGLCDMYKPSLGSALDMFDQANPDVKVSMDPIMDREMIHSFISGPLNALLNERFIKILRYRHNFGQSWSGAEQFFNDYMGKPIGASDPISFTYQEPDIPKEKAATFHHFLKSDHLMEKNGLGASFPLITMQFTLRHFVRCTEFCLVCHCKTNDTFEAIKPYVCSKSLCLFQYMALGFGPSLEWEIITQPYVVDLLASFTYSSAYRSRIADPPTGLGILVPGGIIDTKYHHLCHATDDVSSNCQRKLRYEAMFDQSKLTMKFSGCFPDRRVCVGDWLVIIDEGCYLHCRVTDTSEWPSVNLSNPIKVLKHAAAKQVSTTSDIRKVSVAWYEQNFDDLDRKFQHQMIVSLLDTLPTVVEMKEYLTENPRGSQRTLAQWKDKISKSALDILRWIVASNRSCIIQDDPDPIGDDTVSPPTNNDRVRGVAGYMQFRFAQGAPDKEERFSQAVMAAKERLQKPHATLFAWHGSHLSNWHGILREGLHFKETLHGRAFGHGVYMSPHFDTSASYLNTASTWDSLVGPHSGTETWPSSKLGVISAISLNEVVNSPRDFVSTTPHLVVSQLDWIQTRYLFVSCSLNKNVGATQETKSPPYYHQDPRYVAHGPHFKQITIPLSAFSQQRRLALGITAKPPLTESDTTAAKKQGKATPVKDAASSSAEAGASTSPLSKQQTTHPSAGNSLSKKLNGGPKVVDLDHGGQDGPAKLHVPDSAPTEVPSCYPHSVEADGYLSEETDIEDLNIVIQADKIKARRASRHQLPEALEDNGKGRDKGKGKAQNKTDFIPGTLDPATLPMMAAPKYATPTATASLQRDLRAALRIQDNEPPADLGWYIDPSLVNNVYQWIVELHSFDPSLPLAKDMVDASIKSVILELRFPQQYPISPPFVRVIRPRFLGFQSGGGGHVTAGGALCMELLTNSGWSAVSSIESVLLQVRIAISSTDPRPARLAPGQNALKGKVLEYGVAEAVEAFIRACKMHGWQVPTDFEREVKGGWVRADGPSNRN